MDDVNILTGNFNRVFGLYTTEQQAKRGKLVGWTEISPQKARKLRNLSAKQSSADRAAGKLPYIAFAISGWTGRVTSGNSTIDRYVFENLKGWSDIGEIRGKIHPIANGQFQSQGGDIEVIDACIALTHYKRAGIPVLCSIARPGAWRVPRIALTEGAIRM